MIFSTQELDLIALMSGESVPISAIKVTTASESLEGAISLSKSRTVKSYSCSVAWEIWTRLFVPTKPSSNPMRVVLMIVCFILSVRVFFHYPWLVQTRRTKAEEGHDQSL